MTLYAYPYDLSLNNPMSLYLVLILITDLLAQKEIGDCLRRVNWGLEL